MSHCYRRGMLRIVKLLPLILVGCSILSCSSDEDNGEGEVLATGVSISTPSNFVRDERRRRLQPTPTANGVTTLDTVPLAGGTAGRCFTVPSMQSIAALASDGTTAFAFLGSSIASVPVAGGQVSTLVTAGGLSTPSHLAAHARRLHALLDCPRSGHGGVPAPSGRRRLQMSRRRRRRSRAIFPDRARSRSTPRTSTGWYCVAETLSSLPLTAAPDTVGERARGRLCS